MVYRLRQRLGGESLSSVLLHSSSLSYLLRLRAAASVVAVLVVVVSAARLSRRLRRMSSSERRPPHPCERTTSKIMSPSTFSSPRRWDIVTLMASSTASSSDLACVFFRCGRTLPPVSVESSAADEVLYSSLSPSHPAQPRELRSVGSRPLRSWGPYPHLRPG